MRISFIICVFLVAGPLMAQDPLSEYLQLAGENNPGLRAKYKEFEASVEDAARLGGLPQPVLNFGYFIQPVETRVGPQLARFSLSQMFPWFGTLNARSEGAMARSRSFYFQFINEREKLVSEVKTEYFRLWEIQRLISLEEDFLAILRSFEELLTTRMSSNQTALNDVYQLMLQIEESQYRLKSLKAEAQLMQRNFNRLLNRDPVMEVSTRDSISLSLKPFYEEVSQEQHPRNLQIQALYEEADWQKKAAIKSGFPQLGLGLDYVIVGERQGMSLEDNGKDVIMPMLSIGIPIWRKSYRANVKKAELMQEQFQNRQQDMALELQAELEEEQFEMKTAVWQIEQLENQIDLANKTLELLISDYSNDRAEFEEILTMQEKLIRYRRQKLNNYVLFLIHQAKADYLSYQTTSDENKI